MLGRETRMRKYAGLVWSCQVSLHLYSRARFKERYSSIRIEFDHTNQHWKQVSTPHQKSDRISFESDTECTGHHIAQVDTKNTQEEAALLPEVRVENRQVVSSEHQILARIALVLLSCFYLLCLACLGWTGMKAVNSAKVLLLPKTIAHSFGKFVFDVARYWFSSSIIYQHEQRRHLRLFLLVTKVLLFIRRWYI